MKTRICLFSAILSLMIPTLTFGTTPEETEEALTPPQRLAITSEKEKASLLVFSKNEKENVEESEVNSTPGHATSSVKKLPTTSGRPYTEVPENTENDNRSSSTDSSVRLTSTLATGSGAGGYPDRTPPARPAQGGFDQAPTPSQTINRTTSKGPIADPFHPPIKTASFQNVTPGITTHAELNELWGKPVKQRKISDGRFALLYSDKELKHVEVMVKEGFVDYIVVELEEPFPKKQVRETFRNELLESRPLLIPNEKNEIIGEVFPEKGIMFILAPSIDGREFLVTQIGIEPVSSELFIRRAEATLTEHPTEAKRDLVDAIQINSKDAKAYFLLAKIEMMQGSADAAILNLEQAIRIDEKRPAYHIALAKAMGQLNRTEEAKIYLEEVLPICQRTLYEKAQALSLLGDLYRQGAGSEADYAQAYDYHREARQIAISLLDHSNATVRQTAMDTLFETNLSIARDIVWGFWNEKGNAMKWIDQAKEIAIDPEMVAAKRFSQDYRFRIAVCVLVTQVALSESKDLEPYIRDVVNTGGRLLESTKDPIVISRYHWEMGLSLYDAVQIYQKRKKYSDALKFGELTAYYMENGIAHRKSDVDLYLLGRLYYRLGTIHVTSMNNHRAAIDWFDKAKPIFERLYKKINPEEMGRLGEAYVVMGASYWLTNQKEEAVRLTGIGARLYERGVKLETVDISDLIIAYKNLAVMTKSLDRMEEYEYYQKQIAEHQLGRTRR